MADSADALTMASGHSGLHVLVSGDDCNSNGIPDECDIDCGSYGGPCDLPGCGGSSDCNNNGAPDECDIADESSEDCQPDGVPDECQIQTVRLPFSGPEPLNNNAATDSGADERPQVSTDGAGNWVAVWVSDDDLGGTIGTDRDILVSRSGDNGLTWSHPEPLNNNAATDSGGDLGPQVTTDSAGNWVAVWHSQDDLGGTIGADCDILVSRSSDNGLSWTDPIPLNNNAATDSGQFDVAAQVIVDGAGNWLAVWHSDDDLAGIIGTDFDILMARSGDGGLTWTDPIPLNNNAATDSEWDDVSPQVTTDGGGNWLAVWSSQDALGQTIGTDEDIVLGRTLAADCNGNGVPDECDVTPLPVLLSADFQDGLPGGWTVSGLWHVTDQCLTPNPCDRPGWVYFGRDRTCDFDTGAREAGALTTPPIEIPGHATGATLTYCSAYHAEGGQSPVGFDSAWVAVNGTPEDDVSFTTTVESRWEMRTVDLTAYVGQTVTITWSFDSIDERANDTLGWKVDAIELVAEGVIASDCNSNGIPDECERDCNDNGVPDDCDVDPADPDGDGRFSRDCDGNGVPDECDPDFDNDGLIDGCDLDIDNDGVRNEGDACTFTPLGARIVTDPEDPLYGTLRHDSDGDCDVDLVDYAILQQELTGPNP